jgi:serine protease inhibitor
MCRFVRIDALLVAIIFAIAACGSTSPTPVPSQVVSSVAPPSTSRPSAAPSIAVEQPADPFLGSVVKTISDHLRVRSQPRVADDSTKYEPLLPLGTELQVVGGPVDASGYTWYEVEPVSLTLADGIRRGWVAMGDHDGTPWIAVAQPPINGLEVVASQVERMPAYPKDATQAATSITAFGLELYRRMLTDPDFASANAVFSPTSIALALGMARAGAKGDTATQMDAVLHTGGWADLGPGLNALDQAITSRDGTYTDDEGKSHSLALRIANSAFAQYGWTIEPSYLDAIAAAFGAGVRLVDYKADPAAARQTINAWVSRQTEGRIPELLRPPNVTADTRLYLVNAMYLKANWVTEFDAEATTPRTFTRLDGSTADVTTMQLFGGQEVPYVMGDGWQATELRYRGRDGTFPLAMDVILPDDLTAFEAHLTPKQLASISSALTKERTRLNEDVVEGASAGDCGTYPYSLKLRLPKFSAGTRVLLGSALAALGMPAALDSASADFTGIHSPDEAEAPIFIKNVIHQANIDVDETGTEAAAATAIGMDTGGCTGPGPAKEITLRVDHPFVFVLRDLETDAILFMGRILDPSIPR